MAVTLQVLLYQARNLAAKDSSGSRDPFVRLQLGKNKAKTATIYKNLNPVWNENFMFKVEDIEKDVLQVTVWDEDFFGMSDFLGQLQMKVSDLTIARDGKIPRRWYTLRQKSEKAKGPVSGDIELSFNLLSSSRAEVAHPPADTVRGTLSEVPPTNDSTGTDVGNTLPRTDPSSLSSLDPLEHRSSSENNGIPRGGSPLADLPAMARAVSTTATPTVIHEDEGEMNTIPGARLNPPISAIKGASKELFKSIRQSVNKMNAGPQVTSLTTMARNIALKAVDASVQSAIPETPKASDTASETDASPSSEAALPLTWFDKPLKDAPADAEVPTPLEGGVVLEQAFMCKPHELNAIMFHSDSAFFREFSTERKLTQVEIGPWLGEAEGKPKRTLTYMTAPSSLVKSVKATEEMRYIRADAEGYVVESLCATPDVPYGNYFLTQMQMCILPRDEGGCILRVSFAPLFTQNIMMRSMIESGMRTGIRETYNTYLQILSKHAKPVGPPLSDQDTSTGAKKPIRNFRDLAAALFLPSCYVVFFLSVLLLPLHFWRVYSGVRGIPIWPLELPGSISQLITTAIITLASYRAIRHAKLYTTSRLFSKGDAGIKSQGEGWVLSITLVEGENIGGAGLRDLVDSFVVFTCNGKTRRSSVKLKAAKPKWNEVLEFDAFEHVPSLMEVELFDYEGPFSEADLLGRAEVNFLRQGEQDLADMWLLLEGRKARLHGSRLHLRVQLTQTHEGRERASEMVQRIRQEAAGGKKEKVVKKAGTSEQTIAFRKLFDLPDHDHLISDFSCAVKKGVLLQGRVFLSPRILGFHSNLFGMKTRFILLWEDIEDMGENVQTINRVNRILNPSITLFLKKDRSGADIQQAAFGVDEDGRPKVRLQSFIRPVEAFKTIRLLWSYRALSPEQQLLKVQEAQAQGQLTATGSMGGAQGGDEDGAVYTGGDPPQVLLSTEGEVHCSMDKLLMLLKEKRLQDKVSEELGQLQVEASEWVEVDGGYERNVKHTLSRQKSPFESAVSVVQKATCDPKEKPSWAVLEEAITLHNVPFGEHFQVILKSQAKQKTAGSVSVSFSVSIMWQKETSPDTKDKTKRDVAAYYKEQGSIIQSIISREIP